MKINFHLNPVGISFHYNLDMTDINKTADVVASEFLDSLSENNYNGYNIFIEYDVITKEENVTDTMIDDIITQIKNRFNSKSKSNTIF